MPQHTDDPAAPGVGTCTVTVDDQRNISYSCDPIEPDQNNNIVFYLQSAGPTKTWSFNPNDPINIDHPNDFTVSLVSSTQLNVTDSNQDDQVYPQHNYTLKIQSQSGEQAEFDPIIKDRTTQMA
jgi:hypothetical protein